MKNIFTKFMKVSLIIITIYSCNNNPNLIGTYSTTSQYTIDTLILKKENQYERILRRKSDKGLIFKKKGVWSFNKDFDRINLNKFYVNSNFEDEAQRDTTFHYDNILIDVSLPFLVRNEKPNIVIFAPLLNHEYLKID